MDIADKIRKIEVLIAGAKSDGERQAAECKTTPPGKNYGTTDWVYRYTV